VNLLVLSATASAINYKNSLRGRPDVRLFLTDASPFASGLYAPHVTPLLVPRAADLLAYRASLDRLIAEHAIDALVPTSDADVAGVMELLRQGWDPKVRMFRPPYEAFHVMHHKARLMEALAAKGFDVPRRYASVDEVEFPAVIKPSCLGGSKGVWVVQDRDELVRRQEQVRRLAGEDYLLQEFIPGGLGSIHVVLLLYGHDSRVHGEQASHSHLTYMTWGGGGNAGVPVNEPGLLELARDMVEALGGWAGPINLEFKRHEQTGRFALMEVNCRLNGYSYLATMNGLDFPAAIVDLLEGRTPRRLEIDWSRPPVNFLVSFRERPVDRWVV
jgi:predicted ATP-grasp superfamily ATP-dependent carboligase